jgi:putative two-component system response regulator
VEVSRHLSSARLLLVDDQEGNLRLLRRLFAKAGYTQVEATRDPREVPGLYERLRPDLILLDLHMPGLDGFGVLEGLARIVPADEYLPVLVLTGDLTREARERALKMGARDFLTKPIDPTEVLLRSENLLETRFLHLKMNERVLTRTRELEESRLEALERLARAAEFRDDATGQHTRRVGEIAGSVAEALGWEGEMVQKLRRAAPLHDLGKVGIPDAILLKPGRLTPEEFEVMKGHSRLGAELLAGSRSELMRMAEEIALAHHERWDGTGYPEGRRADEIPPAARIVAVADFFDALTHDRPYRRAVDRATTLDMIAHGRGRHFDPVVAEALLDTQGLARATS